MSFKNDCWIGHFNPPPSGPFKRASIFVLLSRWAKLGDVLLLAPLWKTKREKAEVVARCVLN